MFAGNVGEAQDMDSIMQAALLLKEQKDIKIILVGDGRKKAYVDNFIEENSLEDTVICVGRYPVEAMASFFDKSDVMLVSLKDDPIFNLTVPAKVQAYMSAEKPILAMLNGEGAAIVEEVKCGFTVPASDAEKLAAKIVALSLLDKEELIQKGRNGKRYFEANFKMSACIDNLERILQSS
ncbi:glycosyltransferase family 4 protein [Riemerella anatipestifer]|nr:glycosyltransferase family 4 protein [Riemerella anatipestifer]